MPTSTNRTTSSLALIHGNILIYAFAFWLTQPVLPFLLQELSADKLLFSRFQTFCSFLQLLGGPLAGRICDTFGFSITLGASQAAASLSYALLAASTSVPTLFLSQLPTMFMHAMHAAQSAMTILAPDNMRATAMGRLSLSYGVGMVLGSYVGGVVSVAYSTKHSAILAAVLSAAVLPVNWVVFHGISTATPSSTTNTLKTTTTSLDVFKIVQVLRQPQVWGTLTTQVLLGLALSLHRSTFSDILRQNLSLDPQGVGLVMSVSGVVSILANGVLLQLFLSRWSERSVALVASGLIALSFGAYANLELGPSVLQPLMALTVLLSGASAIAYTVLSSQMSKGASKDDRATAIGLSHASRSACGLVAPTLGTMLLHAYGFQALGYFCSAMASCSVVYSARQSPSLGKTKKDD
ncbi:hypothetical protein H257_06155 [Aphanomyces astaci]|uniref:Major facilitator superfamily (MFS) profile domain-containing protein n=1 Tax=Aphanomyces astaci TaxID=112090 RepID=W4GLU4_APHAT|nr:hypothetical protein H257_06155 [Aphanomyces astaci]ETV80632.1 hypothetical protein H257_06155 [Aphanomyces astaci]|eukprot:XP_009829579.1 hypothetical protein H257_06155 [Aphanomyces astaci]